MEYRAMSNRRMILPALVLLSALLVAGPVFAADNDLQRSAMVEIGSAGSTAGLVRACGFDPTPIKAAARQLAKRVRLNPQDSAKALARYRTNEARMTETTLSFPGARLCDEPYALMQDTVHDLNAVGAAAQTAQTSQPTVAGQ
jgi:hypothetical protein